MTQCTRAVVAGEPASELFAEGPSSDGVTHVHVRPGSIWPLEAHLRHVVQEQRASARRSATPALCCT